MTTTRKRKPRGVYFELLPTRPPGSPKVRWRKCPKHNVPMTRQGCSGGKLRCELCDIEERQTQRMLEMLERRERLQQERGV